MIGREYIEYPSRPRFKESSLICIQEVEGVCYFRALKARSAPAIWQLSIALALFVLAIVIVVFLRRFRYLALIPLSLGAFIVYFFISTTFFFTDSPIDPALSNPSVDAVLLLSSESINSVECQIIDPQSLKAIIAQDKICVADWCMSPTSVKETAAFVIISDRSNSVILARQKIGTMAPGIHSSTSKPVDLKTTFCR